VSADNRPSRAWDIFYGVVLAIVVAAAAWQIVIYVSVSLRWGDLAEALLLGVYTMIRVIVLMIVATAIWVPIGVWLGLRPTWARRAQPVAQFLAAFPANLFFPIFVVAIVHWQLSPDIWLTPLMVLGAQWYILFNVIAGAAAFPGDLLEASNNFRIGGLLWWRRVILPGIFSYYVTGAITASGGAWNAAIVSEVASWGNDHISAHGLGAYIAQASADDHGTPKVVLGVAVMSAFVLMFNRIVWRPMYAYAARRFTFS
jgi:NitT/TauT family transport system permease protein